MIRALHHVQIAMPVAGRKTRGRSNRDVLGMEEQPKPANLAQRGGAWFSAGEAQVHLGVEDDFGPAKKAYPALLVTQLQELIERCRDAGYAITNPLSDRWSCLVMFA